MNSPTTYIASALIGGEYVTLREHTFTRWLSRDLLQAATDFCKNIGLVPLYVEASLEQQGRYIFWRMPAGATMEVRSGRTKEKFEDFDRLNHEKGWRLLTLHISTGEIYSAVWINADHYEQARAILGVYGVSPAERRPSN